jgi:hypothetical protein
MEPNDYIEHLQEQINQIIGVKSTLKRRRKNREDIQRNIFLNVIPLLEHAINRGTILESDFNIDVTKYEELFYQIIDSLIYLHFDPKAAEVILFYLYERFNPDGTSNSVLDANGNEVMLETTEDLWNLVQFIETNPKKKNNA